MATPTNPPQRPGKRFICRPWITVKGRKITRPNGKMFCFWVNDDK